MNNKEENKDFESGNKLSSVELAEGGEFQQNKMNSADTLADAKFSTNSDSPRSSSQSLKKCLIGITVAGIVILVAIMAVVASSANHLKPEPCPPYHYRDPKVKFTSQDGTEISQNEGVCVMGTCNFENEIMNEDGSCEACKPTESVNGMGTKCIQVNCMANEFVNQDDQCEMCPYSYFKQTGKCYQADRAKIDMVQTFEKNPDFAHYSNVHMTTQNIAQYFDEKSKNYKGFITLPSTGSLDKIQKSSPITKLISETDITGPMMYIHQIQEEPNSPYFMDVQFINSNMDRQVMKKLETIRDIEGTKCCWTNSQTGESFNKYFTGFARIIEYADYQRNGASPEYAFKITEGQIQNGKAHGFARVISGFKGSVEFGFFDSNNSRLRLEEGKATDFDPSVYKQIVNKWINGNKMVVFTKSYCPYSRALLSMLDEYELKGQYKVFQIDREDHGNEIHKVIKEISGMQTIPNVFLNGEHLGGDEDVEKMAKDGSLKKKLDALGIQNTF